MPIGLQPPPGQAFRGIDAARRCVREVERFDEQVGGSVVGQRERESLRRVVEDRQARTLQDLSGVSDDLGVRVLEAGDAQGEQETRVSQAVPGGEWSRGRDQHRDERIATGHAGDLT
jgi:hypothetical protein